MLYMNPFTKGGYSQKDQGLHCLPITILGVSQQEWVNNNKKENGLGIDILYPQYFNNYNWVHLAN